MEAHGDGHGQKSAHNSRRTNRLPTPKTKKHHKKRFYGFVSSMGQSIFSSY
jgi:hypothetical protein